MSLKRSSLLLGLFVTCFSKLSAQDVAPRVSSVTARGAVIQFEKQLDILRDEFDDGSDKLRTQFDKRLAEHRDALIAALESERKSLTQADKLDQALEVREAISYYEGLKVAPDTAQERRLQRLQSLTKRRSDAVLGTQSCTDVLQRINPRTDAVLGDWQFFRSQLIVPQLEKSLLAIPIDMPDDFVLVIQVERSKGTLGFGVVLPVSESCVELYIDGGAGAGLNEIAGKGYRENGTLNRNRFLPLNAKRTLIITVRGESVHVSCNGVEVVDWVGNADDLQVVIQGKKAQPGTLALTGHRSEFHVHQMTLVALSK